MDKNVNYNSTAEIKCIGFVYNSNLQKVLCALIFCQPPSSILKNQIEILFPSLYIIPIGAA